MRGIERHVLLVVLISARVMRPSASTAMPSGESLEAFAATGATLVLHLAIRRARELADRLAEHYGADCPVAVAYRVEQPE